MKRVLGTPRPHTANHFINTLGKVIHCLEFTLKYSSKREKGKKAVEANMAYSLIIIKSVIGIEGFITFYLALSALSSTAGLQCYSSSTVQSTLFLFFLTFQEA